MDPIREKLYNYSQTPEKEIKLRFLFSPKVAHHPSRMAEFNGVLVNLYSVLCTTWIHIAVCSG